MSLSFDNSYARLPERFYQRTAPAQASDPKLLLKNEALAAELGIPADVLSGERAAEYFSGTSLLPTSEPLALAYAGHQFGGFVPQLGDGRAHLLGEVLAPDGRRYDIQLKGSGPTHFSRGGDGRAALGPVLREYLVSEAMHALGIPTSRSLAVTTTGEPVYRQSPLPGAVLTRVASSHLRVGTFEYFAARQDAEGLRILVDYALERHYPDQRDARPPAETLLDCVISAQASLIAHWMSVGFVHGVMNTDNCTISGETIDYGPCAFLDAYDEARTFSSIDRGGRYAYFNQPQIAQWNMARLAEALLPLFGGHEEEAVTRATALLRQFPSRYQAKLRHLAAERLGVPDADAALALDKRLRALLSDDRADFTFTYSLLEEVAKGQTETFLAQFPKAKQDASSFCDDYRQARAQPANDPDQAIQSRTPLYIPRNHWVEEALEEAQEGNLELFNRLLEAVRNPWVPSDRFDDFARPPGPEQWSHVTFCGT